MTKCSERSMYIMCFWPFFNNKTAMNSQICDLRIQSAKKASSQRKTCITASSQRETRFTASSQRKTCPKDTTNLSTLADQQKSSQPFWLQTRFRFIYDMKGRKKLAASKRATKKAAGLKEGQGETLGVTSGSDS